MSSLIQEATIKIRQDTSGNWGSENPTPLRGEWCLETDTGLVKIGDGTNNWNNLDYYVGSESIGTSGQVLTSNGAGNAPSMQGLSANDLNDYEQGMWTPTVDGDATGEIDSPSNSCYYTKIGNIVTIVGGIKINSNFADNSIGGLPFQLEFPNSPFFYASFCSPLIGSSDSILMVGRRGQSVIKFFDNQDYTDDHAPNTSDGNYRFTFSYRT